MFTEEYQVDFLREYHKAFDKLMSDFLVGEMVWNFADFMTVQGILIFLLFAINNCYLNSLVSKSERPD